MAKKIYLSFPGKVHHPGNFKSNFYGEGLSSLRTFITACTIENDTNGIDFIDMRIILQAFEDFRMLNGCSLRKFYSL